MLLAAPAAADRIRAYEGASGPPTEADLACHYAELGKGEAYFERWTVQIHRKDGGWMQLQYVLSNVGPGDAYAVVDAMRWAPPFGQTEGEPGFRRWPKRWLKGDWSCRADRLDLRVKDSRLRRTAKGLEGALEARGYRIEFTLTAQGPGFRPGDGWIRFPDGGRFGVQLAVNEGVFAGRERLDDGAWQPVTGRAWADHGVTTMMAHRLSQSWLRFRGRAGDLAVHYLELFTPEKWAAERFGFLVVTDSKGIVVSATAARAAPSRFLRDREPPHHRVPIVYRVTGSTPQGEVALEVRVGALVHREDVLAPMPAWIQRLLRAFIQPINFFNRGRFRLTLPDGRKVTGKGMASFHPMWAK